MSLATDIVTALSGVVVALSNVTLRYRPLLSTPTAPKREWGDWVTITGSRSEDAGSMKVFDPNDGIWYIVTQVTIRIPYTAALSIKTSDQLEVDGMIHEVREVRDAAGGAAQVIKAMTRTPALVNPRTGGGI